MANIEITSVNIIYNKNLVSGVNVNFYVKQSENQTINMNGYVPLTYEEYIQSISGNMDGLKEKVIEKISEFTMSIQ